MISSRASGAKSMIALVDRVKHAVDTMIATRAERRRFGRYEVGGTYFNSGSKRGYKRRGFGLATRGGRMFRGIGGYNR